MLHPARSHESQQRRAFVCLRADRVMALSASSSDGAVKLRFQNWQYVAWIVIVEWAASSWQPADVQLCPGPTSAITGNRLANWNVRCPLSAIRCPLSICRLLLLVAKSNNKWLSALRVVSGESCECDGDCDWAATDECQPREKIEWKPILFRDIQRNGFIMWPTAVKCLPCISIRAGIRAQNWMCGSVYKNVDIFFVSRL